MDPLSYIIGIILLVVLLFVPGYFVTLALFPRKDELNELELLIFSFAFSISVLPLLTLIEMLVFGWLLTSMLVWANFFVIVVLFGFIWAVRVRRVAVPEKVYSLFRAVASKDEGVPLFFEDYFKAR